MSERADCRGFTGEHFLSLFERVPVAVCLVDRQDNAIRANRAFERLFGFRRDEVEGRSLVGLIIPPGRETELAGLARAVLAGRTGRVETTRLRKDGSAVLVAITLFPATDKPGEETLYAVYTDLQELRDTEKNLLRAQDKYQSIFEHAPRASSSPHPRVATSR